MIAPRRLPAVVFRLGRRQPLIDEFSSLLENAIHAPHLEIGELLSLQAELSAERRCGKTVKHALDVDHLAFFLRQGASMNVLLATLVLAATTSLVPINDLDRNPYMWG